MANSEKSITQVYQLPSDDAARTKFLSGIKALAEECQATWVSGSVHNEILYVETLEAELAEHVGEQGVENIRQDFERSN